MTALSVNLNAVAQLRNRRDLPWPSVVGIARVVLDAGADGITVHPRPDERHIRRTDVFELEVLLRADYPHAEYNIEGYPSEAFLQLVEAARPNQVTFVPDDPAQATSDHGWDIAANRELLERGIDVMKALGIRVSLFIDADPAAPARAWEVGADRVEIYTGPYGASYGTTTGADELNKLSETANAAKVVGHNARAARPGLGINAGHDLTLVNLPALQAAVPGIDEVSIGHAITADALLMGFPKAVRKYKAALAGAS
ncbi:MAG: pyridoxine 5'-phosphate synthase [Devosia sp.]|nr:pyridoxine 5'-phosphate synthase [Devosia sp.]